MNGSRAETPSATPLDVGGQLNRFFLWLTSGLALAALVLVLLQMFAGLQVPGKPGWPEAALLCLATFATVANLGRQLPLQNVLLAAVIIACLGSAAHLLTAATAIPFGPIRFTEEIGPKFFDQLGWPMPLLWILAVLNSRGVARMILRPWRKLRVYGFWLIGLTVVLTVAFDVALEPYAAHSRHYWIWLPTRLPLTWHTAPVSNFPAWALTAGLILAFASPSLINKDQRPRKSKPDAHPLILWLLAVLFLSANSAQAGFLSAAAFGIAAAVIAAAFAIRGARW